jgi:hypothetical protein
MYDLTIWRMYNDGSVKDETHVLWPHRADGQQCTGYNGDVAAWSQHNQKWRPGCAQIVRRNGQQPVVIYQGYPSKEKTGAFIKAHTI